MNLKCVNNVDQTIVLSSMCLNTYLNRGISFVKLILGILLNLVSLVVFLGTTSLTDGTLSRVMGQFNHPELIFMSQRNEVLTHSSIR